jgi:Bacteriophage tail sheath protein
MPTYLHPGVYIEEIPSGAKTIEGVGTSTAAFIGYTTKGPLGSPLLLLNFDDYRRRYGGIRDLGAGELGDAMGFSVAAFFQNGGTKAYVVRLARGTVANPLRSARAYIQKPAPPGNTDALEFTATSEGQWANGLIVRVTPKPGNPNLFTVAVGRLDDRGNLRPAETYGDVSMDAASPRFIESVLNGVSPNVGVSVEPLAGLTPPAGWTPSLTGTSTSGDLTGAALDFSALPASPDRDLRMALDGTSFTVTVPAEDFTGRLADLAAAIQAVVRDGAAVTAERRTSFTAVAAGNRLVLTSGTRGVASSAVVDAAVGVAPALHLGTANGGTEQTGQERLDARVGGADAELTDGADGEEAQDTAYESTFSALVKVRDINIISLPGKTWDAAGQAALQLAIAHAEETTSRMVIVDPPAGTQLPTELSVVNLGLPTSTYSVLYYPWVHVANPFYDEDDNPGVPTTLLVPPSGYAAGMWAKIDGRRGVWKAPAGVETNLLGLSALRFDVGDGEQDQLNPLGVNALRKLPGFGHVIWGTRTLSTRANPEWRYVPVRRTAIFIEQSIYNSIQWAVFEPNDYKLWGSLRSNIDDFMNGLWRSNAFQGEKASDAYFVRCNLGDTMTQADIDRGQVIVIVGFAPLKPAEFVIVRIQQKVAQQ